MSNKVVAVASTFFYFGYLPLAPGSFASLAGVGLFILLQERLLGYVITLSIITIIGFLSCGKMEKIVGKKDPSCIVIDEVAGMMIALFMLPAISSVMITSFFLFRAFDMFKIYPCSRLESLPGSAGIMLDDILAGVYTNIILHLGLNFSGLRQLLIN